MSGRDEMQGGLSRDEDAQRDRYTATAAQLLAFLDSQGVTIAPPINTNTPGWLIVKDVDAHVVSAWGSDQKNKLEKRCATLTEAVDTIRRYEHGLPL